MNTNLDSDFGNKEKKQRGKLIGIFVGVGAVLVLLVAGALLWTGAKDSTLLIDENDQYTDITYEASSIKKMPTRSGEIHLTLTPKSGEPAEESGGPTDGYFYDFETGDIKLVADKEDPIEHDSLFYSFGYDGVAQTYTAITEDEAVENSGDVYTLFFKKTTENREEVVASFPQPPMGPAVISPNAQKVLYTQRAQEQSDGKIANPNKLSIHLAQLEDNGLWSSRKLRDGTSPQWVTNNIFYYLKNNGIYLGTTDSEVEEYIWETSGTLGGNSRLAISNNGKYLAWGLPDAGKTIIFTSTYDEELGMFILEELYTIENSAFWLAFSPDNKRLAMQAVDWSALETNPNPRIEIYSMDTGKKDSEDINLDYFIQTAMFLTDWR